MEMLLHGNALLALSAAVLWGGGDFAGGMGVKRAGGGMGAALRLILLSHAMSFGVLSLLALLRGDPFPHGAALAWGVAAGATAGISLSCFYIALSRGAMGASAALSGLLAAAIPSAFSILWEGSPGPLRMAGFVVAGAAIWLIAAGPNPESRPADRGTFWLAFVGGVGFGVYFTGLKLAAATTGVIWPLVTCRMGSLAVCALMLVGLASRASTA
ncbi:MAG: transporter, partial [Acidobacteriota bacterium]|nr:transporter [Acidobacteriota bacterium]